MRRLFERYRQFQALPPDEVSRELRERRDEQRAREVVFVPELDLSRTAWHEPPHPEAVNAATFALRRRMNAYPDPAATRCASSPPRATACGPTRWRSVTAPPSCCRTRARSCATTVSCSSRGRAGGRCPTSPSAPAARRCRWPVEGGIGPLADRVGAGTRAVALSSPNDPTGAPVARADVRALCERVGERVWVLLDEAFADFLEPGEDAAALVAELPNLLVFRTFAKAHAMAGFRIGYVLAPTAELAEQLTPSFSVNAPAQAAAAWALELGDGVLERRRAAAKRERERLARALHGTSLSFAPSAAPFVWLSSDAHDAEAIAAHLRVRRIVVAPGERWGDERHVRITLRDSEATDRLISALRELG